MATPIFRAAMLATPARHSSIKAMARLPIQTSHRFGTKFRRSQANLGLQALTTAVWKVDHCIHTTPSSYEPQSSSSSTPGKRRVLVEITDETKVEQSLRRELEKQLESKSNESFTFLIDRRSQEEKEREEDKAASEPPKQPLYKRIFTVDYWKGMWQSIVHEFHHYRAGFALMWADIKIASRLTYRVLNGQALSRRERQQFIRTAGDLFRLVPFSVFIIVPGAELLLPFAIKLFPGMLPSQFQQASNKAERIRAQLRVKLEMAKFLQDTVEEMAVQAKSKEVSDRYHELAEFLDKGRKSGNVTTHDILKFSQLFKDDITLDNLGRSQLRAMCRLLSLPSVGTSAFLRYQLRMKLRALRADDLIIMKEGIDSLSVPELQSACRERGMRAIGISTQGLRQQLQQWLDLHITHGIPSTLLILSRIMFLPESVSSAEKIRYVLEGLPDALKDRVKVEVLEAEGARVDSRLRLEILTDEESKIREETQEEEKERLRLEQKRREEEERAGKTLHEPEAPSVEEGEVLQDKAKVLEDTIAKELAPKTAKPPAHEPEPATAAAEQREAAAGEEEVADDRLTLEDCIDLALVIDRLSGKREGLDDLEELKEEISDHKLDLDNLNIVAKGKLQASVGSMRLSNKVENMMRQLEENLSKVDEHTFKQLDLDQDGVISQDELLAALRNMKNRPSEAKMRKLADVLDADHDGKLRLDVLQKVLDFIEHEGRDVHPDTLAAIVKLVEKESTLESDEDEPNGSQTKAGNSASS